MPRPVHFEIHAGEPERAVRFYTEAFGWSFERWGEHPYWVVRTGDGGGIDGGLVPRRGPNPDGGAPLNAFPVTIDVPDVDAFVQRVTLAGGKVAVPRMAIPGVGWLVYCQDTEGNLFGMMQEDAEAK